MANNKHSSDEEAEKQQFATTKEATKNNAIVATFFKCEPNYEWQVHIEHGWGQEATMNHCVDCKDIVPQIRNVVFKMESDDDDGDDDDTTSKYPAPKILENGTHSIFCKCFDCEEDRARERRRKERKEFWDNVIDWIGMVSILVLAVILYLAALHAIFVIYAPPDSIKCPTTTPTAPTANPDGKGVCNQCT